MIKLSFTLDIFCCNNFNNLNCKLFNNFIIFLVIRLTGGGKNITDIRNDTHNIRSLRINLTQHQIHHEELDFSLINRFIGGRGLGVGILYDQQDPKVESLSSENKLIFATGPLTGTHVPFGSRYEVITKSPLTGTITAANAGGNFGTYLRRAGFDVIIIEGCSKKPVFLTIENNKAELKNSTNLWGSDTHSLTDKLTSQYNMKRVSVACIGPAGENKVRFASIINDKHRAAGRGGVGAVMGYKKLKAIVVACKFTNKNKIGINDDNKFNRIIKKMKEKIKTTTVTRINLPKFGTAKILDSANNYKLLGTRNFTQNYFEDADSINAQTMNDTVLIKNSSCFGCPVACKRVTRVGKETGEGPEFETIWAFGAQCGINDLSTITKTNYLCNKLGSDTISTGNTIGCAMELSEKGYISDDIKFGDSDVIEKLVNDIAYRNELGDELAQGSKIFAQSKGHPELSMTVKGLELPAYDPRVAQAQGLGYATSTRGACHVRAFVVKSDMVAGPQKTDRKSINEKTKLVINSQNKMAVIDSLGMCLFSSFVSDISDYRGLLEAAVGIKIGSDEDLLRIGEGIWNLERLFNQAAGFGINNDVLPTRFTNEPVKDDLGYEHVWPEKELIADYYNERGWTKNGKPKKSKLVELGIRTL
jgi:aldehyde:ferredoxin oxidoreductase